MVARLRDVDPTAELIYLGAGQWLLGSVQPNEARRLAGGRMIARQLALPPERRSVGAIRLGTLFRQGFRPIAIYEEADLDSGFVVADFRFRDWRYRHNADRVFEERLDEVDDAKDLERRIVQVIDMVHGEFPDLHRYAFLKRHSVLSPGAVWRN